MAVERKPQLALEDSALESPTKTIHSPAKASRLQESRLVPANVGEDEANNEEKPIMLPSRGRCQCTCGCKERPGTKRECTSCHQMVGPGCIMPEYEETQRICHMCGVIPEPDPAQLQREKQQKVMRKHKTSGAVGRKRPASNSVDADQGYHLVGGTLGFPFC